MSTHDDHPPADDLGPLPNNPDLERAILGSIMAKPNLRHEIGAIITGADFYQPAHELAWHAICDLVDQGKPTDVLAVSAELAHRGQLKSFPGEQLGVFGLWEGVDIPENAIVHARTLADLGTQRRLIDASIRIRQMANAGAEDAQTLLQGARATLEALEAPTVTETRKVGEIVSEIVDGLGTATFAGHDTPWPDLNDKLVGLAPGRLHVVAARPSVGKSLFAQGVAAHFSEHHGEHVLFCTLEMTEREMGQRLLAQASKVNLSSITDSRHIGETDKMRIATAASRMQHTHDQRIHLIAKAAQTVASIRAAATALHKGDGLGLVVVDYLQLLTPGATARRDRSREQEVSEMTRAFKALAMDLDIPVLIVAQLNRAMLSRSDKRPNMGDLRESGAIEQDADVVILLHQPDDEQPWDLEVMVEKNRGGKKGTAHLIQQGWIANLASTGRAAHQEAA